MLREKMLAEKVWAVIGASQGRDKFSNKIYRRLKKLGYVVYAVNPGITEIEGDICYPDLRSLPEKPAVINMVVSPKIGRSILQDAADLGISLVWFQPGSWDQEIGQFGEELGLAMLQDCVLVASGTSR